jgi:hypothetical protein
MAIIAEVSWDQFVDGHFPQADPFRKAFREAVEEVSRKARAVFPAESEGRILKAVHLALSGDVELLENGSQARVFSQSTGTAYHVANGACDCRDFEKAPENFCKHRLAFGIYKRASDLAKQRLEAQNESPRPEPVFPESPVETPATTTIPSQFIVELHGKQFVTFSGLLTLAHERGLVSLKADFITVTAEIALAHAVATFADGRTFEESADATPGNVNAKIRPHFPRMALTRSKARCLRDALNISMVAIEELET